MSDHPRPLRVTHLIHDLRPGGAEHLLVDLASIAGEIGIELSVVSMRPLAGLRYAAELHRSGTRTESLDLSGWWDPRGPRRLRRLLPDLRPDVLHSHLKHADVVAGRVAGRAGIPHVSTLHLIEDDVGWLVARKRDLGTRSRLRTADRTVAVSDAVRRWYLESSGADPATVVTIRNGVPDPGEEAGPDSVRAEFGIDPESILAVMVGVMRPGKGHDVVLEALAHVRNDRLRLLLAGDGPEAPALQARTGNDARVVFAGFRPDVGRILAAADLVVHPSERDALPTALIRALAAGRPIVATAVEGIPEIITPEVGILVPPNDPAALAGAMDRLAEDPGLRRSLGEAARRRYQSGFTAIAWGNRLRDLYVGLLGRT